MRKISHIGSLLKKIYRTYSYDLLIKLNNKGFTNLRPSFLEVLSFICETDGPTIKSIGTYCGLKKQTMTSHLNELEKRGYIRREVGLKDKRQQRVFLTDHGQRFKQALISVIGELEKQYSDKIGEIELERVQFLLENFHKELCAPPLL